jgi:hypothetical protein
MLLTTEIALESGVATFWACSSMVEQGTHNLSFAI